MEQNFDLDKYLTGLQLSTILKTEAISQEINIGHGATYSMLFSMKPNYYSVERSFLVYSSIPRNIEMSYYIDDINYGNVFPPFRLLESKKDIKFLSKWVKSSFVKIVVTNLHRYMDGSIVLQAFPEYMDRNKIVGIREELLTTYNYNFNLPSDPYNYSVVNFTPNYRCKTCLSGALITYDAGDKINSLVFQDKISYSEPDNIHYFWGNGSHDCPLLHYTNKAQILLAIINGEIEAI